MTYHQAVIEIARFIQTFEWYCAGVGIVWFALTLNRAVRKLWHRHDGYQSFGGYVHPCSKCGKFPEGFTRKGFQS